MQSPPFPRYLVPLRSKYFPQHPVSNTLSFLSSKVEYRKLFSCFFHLAVGYIVLRSEILLHIKLFGKCIVFEDKQLHLRGKEK